MAAGSDLLDEVFLNAEVDEKVVSDLVGSLESQLAASGHHRGHHRPPEGLRAAATAAAGQLLGNHVVSGGGGSSSPSPGGGGGGGGGGNASAQTGSPGTTTTTTTSSSSSSSSAAATTTANNAAAKMGLSGPETTKPGAGGVQGSVINHNARSQGSTLDGATTTSVSTTTNVQGGSEAAVTPGTLNQGKSVVISTMATALSTRNGKIGSTTVQTLNGSNVVMNSHTSFTATPATANPAIVPAVTPLVNNGPGNVGKVSTVNALLPSASNTVIQTSFLGTGVSSASSPSPTVISSQQPPGLGTGGPTVALVRPPIHAAGPSVAAATQNGSNTVINSTISVGSFPAAAVAAATVGSGVSLQTSLVNSQPGSGVPTAPTTQVIKSESPKTIVQTVTQQQTLAAGGQPSTTGGNMIIGQTMQAGLPNVAPNPGGVPPAPGTPTGLVKGAANTVTQSLPRTPAATTSGIRATLTPTVLAPRQPPQNPTNIQNFQLPPGMVLVRSENGQLLMIPQHALAQMQAQAHAQSQSQATMTPRPATPTSASPVQLSTVQVSSLRNAPGTPIIARQVAPTTIIKQVSQAQTTVQPTTTLQRPPVVQPQIVLGSPAQTTTLGTASAVQTGTPQRTVQGATATSTVATETMENVKKCKNFLSTLIKLASSGKQSTETAANVKELVQNLLDGKIEAEDFTSRLYRELNSSPQPYLVPFLKRSLPALRQLTPDSAAFIQQSQHQQPTTQPTTALTAVMLSGSVQRTAGKTTATVTSTLQQPVISLTQPTQVGVGKQGQPTQVVIQQSQKPGTLIRPPQVTLTQTPMVALRPPHNRIMLTAPQQIQLNPLQTVPVVKQTVLPGTKALSTLSSQAAAAQKNKLKEPGGGSFRDDDDINDVASMAGVNLSEESARILATNSELVGTLTRSCKDETFLLPAPLQRRILEIGKKHGITEIHPDVVSYVSHATQQRLQTLVEKVSETAQQKNLSYKDDERYDQASDVRAQLKFFEQLDQIEKQRKDEQEREILMRAAKSRSRQEDPEQLRLKQKAKEMQQQELAQMRQRDANLTALAAIGPRKKRKVESPGAGSGTEGSSTSIAVPGSSGVGTTRQFTRQRITRVNLRDLIFCLENERETSHSLLLYKAFLK
ncbi:transcription initiation factor TFIID subunit 4 isoform X1 [Anolis carolinensis]|uniref:TATA-box binding protein associated factor 4 n=2 Tax=Anolis carolinensis TaxID=28377 RepID=G1KSB8_ANOCA|nr:PREDICTED: transcription initiation factor TFIID subunit 4 isoform X1 [Anolis carolinensis]|eukprot:XP_008108358.1 PREDICTED: transcription initiation factor TFIID subunit 4 isoform X1 [Anolis carolinensis]